MKATGHSFDQMNTGDSFLASAAACTEKAVYYYGCSCGAKGTDTFTTGTPLGHSYSEYKSDSSKHWRECRCGDKKDEELHQESNWMIITEATFDQSGERQKSCLICNRVLKTETIKQVDCQHKTTELRDAVDPSCQKSGYTGDVVCKACSTIIKEGSLIDSIPHQWDKGTTAVDGNRNILLIRTCKICGAKQTDGKDEETTAEIAITQPETTVVISESTMINETLENETVTADSALVADDRKPQDGSIVIGIVAVAVACVCIIVIDRIYRYKLSQKQ